MRPSCVPAALLAVAVAAALPARADDTAAFLDPANWEGRADIFRIEGGSVIGETTADPGHNTFFCSKKSYGDFELSFRVKLRDAVGNSGVQVRSRVVGADTFVVAGPQVDVGKGYFGAVYGEKVGGYLLKPDVSPVEGREADFNDYKVVVKGNRVTVAVNGTTTVDAEFPDDGGKHPAPASGIVAFQIHGGYPRMRVEYADIRFRELGKD